MEGPAERLGEVSCDLRPNGQVTELGPLRNTSIDHQRAQVSDGQFGHGTILSARDAEKAVASSTSVIVMPDVNSTRPPHHPLPQRAFCEVEAPRISSEFPSSTTSFCRSEKSIDDAERGLAVVQNNDLEDLEQTFANKKTLDEIVYQNPLPEATRSEWRDRIRYRILSTYRRLFAVCFIINVAVIIAMICRAAERHPSFTFHSAATAAGANLIAAVLFRHEHLVNRLFDLALAAPECTPLSIKRHISKIAYCYGGLHSACGCSAMLWYLFYTVLLIIDECKKGIKADYGYALAALAIVSDILLIMIVGLSYPTFRSKYHNIWENTHRWGGYSLVALVLAQVFLLAAIASRHGSDSYGTALIKTPTFWFLLIIICLLVYPWLRLRKVPVTHQRHSNHAIRIYIPPKQLNPGFRTCRGIRVTDNPWRETHSFATIAAPQPSKPPAPTSNDNDNTTTTTTTTTNPSGIDNPSNPSILISRAGDWTTRTITQPPTHLYLKGAPTTGVMRITSLFSPAIILTTGSGIGPCLSFLNCHPTHPKRVLWSARSPAQTYGREVLREVFCADAKAVVVDSKAEGCGRVDLVGLVWGLFMEERAQGVVVISNPRVTEEVVYELERRGVPAFGAVFDS